MILLGTNNASEFYHGESLVSEIYLGTDLAYTRTRPPVTILDGITAAEGYDTVRDSAMMWDADTWYRAGVSTTSGTGSVIGPEAFWHVTIMTRALGNACSAMTYVSGCTRAKYRKYRGVEITVEREITRNADTYPVDLIVGVTTDVQNTPLQSHCIGYDKVSKTHQTMSAVRQTLTFPLNGTTAGEIYPFVFWRARTGDYMSGVAEASIKLFKVRLV